MLPDPLHPAVVHFPIVLAVLLPLFAAGAFWAIRRGSRRSIAWAVPLAMTLLLSGSAWYAIETGEAEEDRVEEVVGDDPIHEHEEAAERFQLLAGFVTLFALGGLAAGRAGEVARAAT
ncbi:MAG: hypothetical protein RQ745_13550, partial [Longimicrobiales bacterium]|nr:hypothetical protein [Longimicrobiales bacterium]